MADGYDYWALPAERNAKECDVVAAVVEDDDPDWGDPLQDTHEDDLALRPPGETSSAFVQPRVCWFRLSVRAGVASGVTVTVWVQLTGAQSAESEQRWRLQVWCAWCLIEDKVANRQLGQGVLFAFVSCLHVTMLE